VINDIDINSTTGEVSTSYKRISVFKGMATQANDDLANVYYPNPVRPGYVGTIKLLV
jgi:hypothetical protein